jgi:hypothetical protein
LALAAAKVCVGAERGVSQDLVRARWLEDPESGSRMLSERR